MTMKINDITVFKTITMQPKGVMWQCHLLSASSGNWSNFLCHKVQRWQAILSVKLEFINIL